MIEVLLSKLAEINALLLDMDGVIFRGSTVIPGVSEALQAILKRGVSCALVTNSAAYTQEQHRARLQSLNLGVEMTVITSAVVTRQYLARRFPKGTRVYVIGMAGLRQALFADSYFIADDHSPEVVVVGHDDAFSYATCLAAVRAIQSGAHFIGTNPDVNLPTEAGLLPEAGAILAFLTAATGIHPTIMGKPSSPIFEIALDLLGCRKAHTLMVGDRLDTDVAGAQAVGLMSALVLTGATTREMLAHSRVKPDYVWNSLADLTSELLNL